MNKIKRSVFLLVSMACIDILPAQTQYFVDPVHGQDKKAGSLKHPFRTLERACREARMSKGDVTVYLRNGRHELDAPLVFAAQDFCGDKYLTLRPYAGEKPVVTGGISLHLQWKAYENGIWQAKVPQDVRHIDMLLADGQIRPMARYPNYDSTAVRLGGTAADAIAPERVNRWKHPEGGFLHAMHASDWGDFHYRFTGKDESGNLQMEGGWQNNRKSVLHKQNRMVENIFEELDAPGEWFFDARSRTLYYYPLPGEVVSDVVFETPRLKHLVELRGTSASPVRNITFEGITFTQTDRTFMEPYEPLLRSDWTIYRGGAILLEGTENCHLINCDFHHLGGNAVFFSKYNRRSSVSGSHFYQVGASAICWVGSPDAVRSPAFEYGKSVPVPEIDRALGPKTPDYPAHCSAFDNLIHHIGLFEKQTTGIELSMCQYITVSHNSIYHTPRAGINVSEGTWGGHLIEYNDVFDTVKETGDHGAFNSWGRDRFWRSSTREMNSLIATEPGLILADATACTTLRYNRFRCDRGWDIDLDDGSSNYHIYNNLCLSGGLKLREGFYRVVENNVLVNSTFHPHVWFRQSGDVFVRNLVMTAYQPIGVSHWGAEVDYNVFTDSLALAEARKRGTDAHSLVHGVEFVCPERGDYRVKNVNEITAACGFKNFGMDDFGVLSLRLRELALTPRFTPPVVGAKGEGGGWVIWSGLTLKNLETLGERSATGMDEERGVYVITTKALGNPFHGFIRPNDVILRFNGKKTDNLAELRKAVAEADFGKPIEISCFREQREQKVTLPAGKLKERLTE